MRFEKHRRTELDTANAAEWREKSFHLTMRFGQLMGGFQGTIIQLAYGTKHGTRGQGAARRIASLDTPLLLPLNDSHTRESRLVSSRDTLHRRAMTTGEQVKRIFLERHAMMGAMRTLQFYEFSTVPPAR